MGVWGRGSGFGVRGSQTKIGARDSGLGTRRKPPLVGRLRLRTPNPELRIPTFLASPEPRVPDSRAAPVSPAAPGKGGSAGRPSGTGGRLRGARRRGPGGWPLAHFGRLVDGRTVGSGRVGHCAQQDVRGPWSVVCGRTLGFGVRCSGFADDAGRATDNFVSHSSRSQKWRLVC